MRLNLNLAAREQFVPYLKRDKRWASVVAHRRAGKTVACIMDLVKKAVEHRGREPRFAYVAPTYTQAKDVAWSYLKEYTAAIPGMDKSESELSVTFPHNKARIRLYGGDAYDRMRGLYLDGVDIDEPATARPARMAGSHPAGTERLQGLGTFIGTPKGRNWFYTSAGSSRPATQIGAAALKASRPASSTLRNWRSARTMLTPEQYAQEYECSFQAAIVGAFYGREMELAEEDKRIGRVPHERAADVFAHGIWAFRQHGALGWPDRRREWHWINYYENSGFALDHYVDWIKALPYKVHQHLLAA
jgi:phage terminase large subunit